MTKKVPDYDLAVESGYTLAESACCKLLPLALKAGKQGRLVGKESRKRLHTLHSFSRKIVFTLTNGKYFWHVNDLDP